MDEILNQASGTIYERGENYYESGYINILAQVRTGVWQAEVEGNYDNYLVEITNNNNGSIKCFCNCPHEAYICKHIVAVALAIKAEEIKPKADTQSWTEVLKSLSDHELEDFLLEFGAQNEDFRRQLLKFKEQQKLSEIDEPSIAEYASQIQHIFNSYEYDEYINYRDVFPAMQEVDELYDEAEHLITKHKYNHAFCILAAIIEECAKVLEYIDDSSGLYSGTMTESIEQIQLILQSSCTKNIKEQIFEWLSEQVKDSNYNNYGFSELEQLYFSTSIQLNQTELAHKFIDNQIFKLNSSSENIWGKEYEITKYLKRKIELFNSDDQQEEAQNIIDKYIHLEDFRKMKINEMIQKQDYFEAERIALDAISVKGNDSFNDNRKWKVILLKIYEFQNDKKKTASIAKELYLDNPSQIIYYRKLKVNTASKYQEKIKNEIIQFLIKKEKGGWYRSSNLALVYLEEKMWKELVEHLKNAGINEVLDYAEHLKSEHPSALIDLFSRSISRYAQQTGRNIYIDLVNYLKQMAKVKGGKVAAIQLKNSLLIKYRNRPAMKEEFAKLGWGK